ncbi:Ubiquitin-conjugating enzyme, E2 [Kalmanozyma brasiliensis GHG001]|uniref:UBC core domain-containing protein n=1 Tax=Kalmanozyma brasiliensis (strain GHG001) TaxID=1365824 RepID=V5E8Q8_KALBG|nr:Ubiquitin-conjugating enzyme, E2 [Kalmanozyma brasiliensis GHG001]EST06706.1 Ubiquitin-conjugating enzyme, E2 [Kalmanozyma brasiliensis GHG001]
MTTEAPAPLRLYRSDVVHRKQGIDAEHKVGMVSRCYLDEIEQDPTTFAPTGLDRQLKHGEYGVLWYPSGKRQIVPSTDLVLVDRVFATGSTCKRSLSDAQSGVVTGATNTLKLQHLFSREEIAHPVPAEDIVKAHYLNRGDLVISDDWIGEIDSVVEEALVGNPDNDRLIRVCELDGRLLLGKIPAEHMAESEVGLKLVALGIREASIVEITQSALYINWLAINQKLSPDEQAKRPKPKALWTDYNRLTLVQAFCERNHEIGDRVIFRSKELKDKHGAKITYHGRQQLPVDVMLIVGTKTELDVLWQDGTRTKEMASDMIPHVNLDEHESWPGDWVYWKSDDQGSVPRVVQSMDPLERTAELRVPLSEPAEIELVPSLEIDVQGADHSVFSLHRGDSVLISERPTGWPGPFLTTVGDPRPDYDDYKMHDDLMKAEMSLVKVPNRVASKARSAAAATDIDWYGTVEDLLLDGTCRVRLPTGRTVVEKLDKLQILSDSQFGMHEHAMLDEDGHDPWDMDADYEDDDMYDDEEDLDAMWVDQDGEMVANGRDDWEDMSDGAPEVAEIHIDESEEDSPSSADTQDATDAATVEKALEAVVPSIDAASTSEPSVPTELAGASTSTEWNQFAVLESAPVSHHFYSKPLTSQPGPQFFKRLQKELKVLASSLPETILVRAYEDRSDLLRVLIIGSEGTPYENAPFLLDFQLTSDFPSKPPVAHFHSWTNGHGRVSPNLYEDGKVCLSVLGTWSGVAEENWTPSKSSLLQVFVSIQALVLVREPYFTEPAYEKLKGKEESRVNSRMYNEKAYILSRGFVRRVLESKVEGFEDEVAMFYYSRGGLRKVVERAEGLLRVSAGEGEKQPEEEGEEAVQGLTKGGGIMLGRTVKALRTMLDASQSKP